jgi:hypothetical protein
MNIKEFFDLPEDQRELLTQLHNKQKKIRADREFIDNERRKLATRELNLQMECEHPFATKVYKAYENEFGNLEGGGEYRYHCEDCGQRWSDAR